MMKKFAPWTMLTVLVAAVAWILAMRARHPTGSGPPYATTVQMTGTQGAGFSGEYVQAGKRIRFSGVIPWSSTVSNLSFLEIRKAKVEDLLVVAAEGGGSTLNAPCGPGCEGVRLRLEEGWSLKMLP